MNNKKLGLILRIDTVEGIMEGTSMKYIVEPKDYPHQRLEEMQERIEDARKNGHILTYRLEMVDESDLKIAYTKSKDDIVYRIDAQGNSTRVEGGVF